jgi:D-alanyl-D-alanine carboxypeptidase (penicillin-binding protein 5/6)
MSKELLKHSSILKYSGTYMETISEGRKTPIELVNHNKLVRFFKGCDGLKTGFTSEAKYCISATAVRDGVRMLSVIMGAPTYKIRNRDASMLLNYGFSKFESKKLVKKDEDIEKISINKSGDKFFMAKASEDFSITIEKGTTPKLTTKIVLEMDKKSYKLGEIVGHCEYYNNGELIGKVKVYSDRDIKKSSGFFENLKFNFKNLFKHAI